MYILTRGLSLLLLYYGPVVFGGDAAPAYKTNVAFSEGGPVQLDEFEEQIVDDQTKPQEKSDNGPKMSEANLPEKEVEEPIEEEELELELEPEEEAPVENEKEMTKAKAEPPIPEKIQPAPVPPAVPQLKSAEKKGQMEFITFTDPDLIPSHRLVHAPVVEAKRAPEGQLFNDPDDKRGRLSVDLGDTVFVAVATVCSAAAVFGLVGAGVCWYRLHKQHRAAQEASYPQYGGTGPSIEKKKMGKGGSKKSGNAAGDASLAYSAQLHHFNQTKQKILSAEQPPAYDHRGQESEDSEGEGEEGDYSVYECPGLAPTGDIEVSNPMFENVTPKSKKEEVRDGD